MFVDKWEASCQTYVMETTVRLSSRAVVQSIVRFTHTNSMSGMSLIHRPTCKAWRRGDQLGSTATHL